MPEMTEREVALKIAEQWLDFNFNPLVQMVPGDPDCDACIIARNFSRAVEREALLKTMLATLAELTSEMLQKIDMSDIPAVSRAQGILDRIIAAVPKTMDAP